MTDLLKLAEMVEAGLPASEVSVEIAEGLGNPEDNFKHVFYALAHESLDAAKALHEAVIPGWKWGIGPNGDIYDADVWQAQCLMVAIKGLGNSPSTAWVAAILRAKNSSTEG